MKVFKFGGASVSTVERIQQLPVILDQYNNEKIMIIVSAMGKTTNALEKVVEAFFAGNKEQALQLFEVVKNQHLTTAKYVLVTEYNNCFTQLSDFFTEVEWLLHDKPVQPFDYYYDQVVCIGELLSTCIISHFLREKNIENTWIDVRDVIRTDDNFRDANIDWTVTEQNVQNVLVEKFNNCNIVLTQGFIGSTDENESMTLGREGSDFSAAIFANLLNAESLTIWKDVEGVMNADPKEFPEAKLISELNYTEVIEMAYYGAQVIHPKTIKPLHNKSIPMYVRSFIDPLLPGTVIHNKRIKDLPSIFVIKQQQALIHLNSQDFSFVGEQPMSRLYELFAKSKVKPNLIQTGAIGVMICIDDRPEKLEQLAAAASELFEVSIEKGLSLLTIRHCKDDIVEKMLAGKKIVLQQETPTTLQALYRND